MFPIYQNFPLYEGVEPDTDFTGNTWQPLSIPGYAATTYRQACIGEPIHGLHYSNNVLNSRDFAAPVTYTLAEPRFSTLQIVPPSNPPVASDFAWDGAKLVPKRQRMMVNSIANGYLCGSSTLIRVPGTIPRVPTDFDKANKLAWKDYALRSTQQGYVLGMELGKGGFIFTTGVGKTFWITFAGSTGSMEVTRKIQFIVQQFGVVGLPSVAYPLEYDTGKKDFVPGGLITNTMVGTNDAVPFKMRLCDVAKNGTKCVLGMYITNEIGADDDGVNQTSTWNLSFAECTFSLGTNGLVAVSGSIVQTFLDTTSRAGNSRVYDAGAIVMPGQLRRDQVIDGDPDGLAVGAYLEDRQVYFERYPAADTVIFEGNLRTGFLTYNSTTYAATGGSGGADIGTAFFGQALGQSRRVGSGDSYDLRVMRTIHMCYDKNDILVPVTMSYTQVDNVLIESTTSVSLTGSGSHTRTVGQSYYNAPDPSYPNGNFVKQGTGNASYEVVTARERYSRKCIELRVNGVLVDYLQVEHALPQQKTTTTATFGYTPNSNGSVYVAGYTTPQTSITDPAPPPLEANKYSPPLAGIVGPLNFVGGYEAVKQAGGSGNVRNTAIADVEASLAKLRFFVRIESNKLVSANFGNAGYSMGVNEVAATYNYKYFVEVLAAGNHLKRTVYDCFNGKVAENNVSGFGLENPAVNIPAQNYNCALNPATNECVVNHAYSVTFI